MKNTKRVGVKPAVRIKRVSIHRVIAGMGACRDAREWMRTFPAKRAIDYWNNCPEPAWIYWLVWKLTYPSDLKTSIRLSVGVMERASDLRWEIPFSGFSATPLTKRRACDALRAIVPWSRVERALFKIGGGKLPKGYRHVRK